MKNYSISTDFKRAVDSNGFLLGLFGMVLVIAIVAFENYYMKMADSRGLAFGYHSQLILGALRSEKVTMALPVICTLPFATGYVDDIKSGFIKQCLHKTGIQNYIIGKLIACGISGGLVLAFGLYLAYGISALVFIPMEQTTVLKETVLPYFPELFRKAITLFFLGAFLSLTGFAIAAITMSRYMAYASPFVLHYFLIILHERYFKECYVLYPKEWLLQSQPWVLGEVGIWILLIELSAVMCLLFTITAKRRLKNA